MANDIIFIAGTLAALGAAGFLADRLLLWMERRGWIYWRKRKGLSGIGADFLQGTSPQAQANKRAMEQERVRKNVRPAEEPPFSVDLDAGVVRLRRPEGRGGAGREDGSGRGSAAHADTGSWSGGGGRSGADH
ncbi:hypothetical protein ABT112_10895 [Streptomyces sp. NPDC002055]|uniref:hypothetical protein n=1 Tax=Streptomyces sp. NPDC002055 TaxID=3154534 RepID=UPI00332036AF